MVIRTRTKRTGWRGSPHSIWSLSHLRDCQASTNQLPPSFLSFYLFQPLIAFRRRGRQILPLILSFRPLSRDLLKATLPPSAKTAHKYQGFILSFLFFGFYSIDKISLLSNRGWSLNSLGFLSIDLHSPLPFFLFLRCIQKVIYIIQQDKVNTADSAFIFLIIQSQSQWSGWSGRRRWSCLVWSLLER